MLSVRCYGVRFHTRLDPVDYCLTYVTKYCLMQLGDDFKRPADKSVIDTIATSGSFRNRWILNRLAQATAEINGHFESFTFGDACQAVQNFWVGDLCDFFVVIASFLFFLSFLFSPNPHSVTLCPYA